MIEEELLTIAKDEFEQILLFVKGSNNTQISDMEKGIFQHLLKLGCILLLMFVQKIVKKRDNYHIDKSGISRAFHSIKRQNYFSVFGKIEIARPYYWEKGSEGICPVDAEFNLPESGRSYLLQEWGVCLSTEQPYEKAAAFLNLFLNMQIWNSSLEEMIRKSSEHVTEFYNNRSVPVDNTHELLVATVDCKGIQMRKSELQKKEMGPKCRRMRKMGEATQKTKEPSKKSGEKEGKKKMSVITAVYTIDRQKRTAEDVIAKHTKKIDNKKSHPPRPQQKIVYGTLEGKAKAFEYLKLELSKRYQKTTKQIALVDGEIKLNEMLKEYLPGFEIVRDFFHVTEYLWDGAHVLYGEGSKEAQALASRHIEMLLKGKVNEIIVETKLQYKKLKRSKTKSTELLRVINYLENGKEYMKYDQYLANGYPIGSGVIEGTCKNLVNDRFEHAGMHWSIKGANALLGLRSIHLNNLSAEYWRYHQDKEKERLYAHIGEVRRSEFAA